MENQDAGYMTYSASIFFNEFSAWSNQSSSIFNKKTRLCKRKTWIGSANIHINVQQLSEFS
jgi:hypothetical protein